MNLETHNTLFVKRWREYLESPDRNQEAMRRTKQQLRDAQ